MSTTTRIAFVTGNVGKFATAREHLASVGVELEQVTLDLDEIQSSSVQEVALHKAQHAFRVLRRPVIVEDSGFYIDELNGFPGPSVKFVIKALGAEGIARLAEGARSVARGRPRQRCGGTPSLRRITAPATPAKPARRQQLSGGQGRAAANAG